MWEQCQELIWERDEIAHQIRRCKENIGDGSHLGWIDKERRRQYEQVVKSHEPGTGLSDEHFDRIIKNELMTGCNYWNLPIFEAVLKALDSEIYKRLGIG